MLNDFLSSWSSLCAGTQPGPSRKKQKHRSRGSLSLTLLASVAWLAGLGCSDPDEGLTYRRNVGPIFNQRCTICHRPGGPSGIDIQNPFSPGEGLVVTKNGFKTKHPELNLPEYNVLAGDPDNSFLLYKIDETLRLPPDPDEDGPAEAPAGSHMPLKIERLDYVQVHVIEEWVKAGAPRPDVTFQDPGAPATPRMPATADRAEILPRAAIPPAVRSFGVDIQPIIGTEADLSRTLSESGGVCTPNETRVCPRCIYCHYEDGPNPPDLTDVFNPQTGLVGADARYRANMKRVDPGNLENSLLIEKLHYENFTNGVARSDYGAQMPYSFDALSRTQVETVRQWILEGAKP
ncbi:MAG: hypothetical protein ABI895_05120 [Deltaproteobacteria bacterium]